jgi:hypothetical protein
VVSAREIIERVERLGVRFEIVGEKLRAAPKAAISAELSAAIGACKPEIIALLRETGPVPCAAHAVEVAARFLREGRWRPEAAPCHFHIGDSGEVCRRCGASWIKHHEDRL